MRALGQCTECHRVRSVQTNGSGLITAAVRNSIPRGICWQCEEEEKRGEAQGR